MRSCRPELAKRLSQTRHRTVLGPRGQAFSEELSVSLRWRGTWRGPRGNRSMGTPWFGQARTPRHQGLDALCVSQKNRGAAK